ncbi:hypothetical protein [Oleiagrimonas sp. C23AA]|uniref:hypothetical protein n=1 Tax=Oleiagrimonas sp. C23AA TaxID=2719047 RepID=UPI00141E7E28|nr:hypothetical protein [Oleiagrimonas sp. C23AA]NII11762.1 hypothetical protein [Oleiagrimonas sp. C23AA]
MNQTATLPIPAGIHPDTLSDPRHTIADKSGHHLVCYCPRQLAGGIFIRGGNMWTIWTPIDFAAFMPVLQATGIIVAEGQDLADWIEASTSPVAQPGHGSGRAH